MIEDLRVVFLDALGTLVEMEPPAPRFVRAAASQGLEIDAAEAEAAFRGEISFYREHHLRGADRESLDALRQCCAEVLHSGLSAPSRAAIGVDGVRGLMLESLHFNLIEGVAEALPALVRGGLRCAVVSNWDVGLHGILEELELSKYLSAVITSAEVGAAKPDVEIFDVALARLEVEASQAIHVGDRADIDVLGAGAAGILPVLAGGRSVPGAVTIDSIADLPGLLELDSLT